VRRDRFCFTCALDDEELREDGNGLEEDGERPEDFCDGVGVIEDESKDECGADEELDTERVDGRVVRRSESYAEHDGVERFANRKAE
jgi:hypothetical protein